VTRVRAATPEAIAEAAALLARGELVAIPTETVYGLAGSATDERALARIFAAKERPTFDPLIVHVAAASATVEALVAAGIVGALRPAARDRAARLLRAFAPGPLTLVLPRGPRIPDLATSGLPTVAVRSPRHPVAQALLAAAGPLAAPSANRFGRISPTSAADVVAELEGRVELVLDGGPCDVGVESTVVAVEADGALVLLRPGGVAAARIETIAPLERGAGGLRAPGMLPSHYAPGKRLILLAAPVPALAAAPDTGGASRLGLLAFSEGAGERFAALSGKPVHAQVLPADAEGAARGLFAALRALDESDAELLFAEPFTSSPEGLGHAIADRLARAARGKLPGP
jgi:L-threonylcarbamoyladenylate synthase